MSKKSICIKVPKQQGEKAIVHAMKLKIVNSELAVQNDERFVYVPILSKPLEDILKTFRRQAADFQVCTHLFPKRKKAEPSVAELLEGKVPTHLLSILPHAIDFIGTIAVIEVPEKLDPYKNTIGEAILKTKPNVRTVLAKASAVSGTYRLREFNPIAGEPKTETIHKEYNCQYYVDVAKVYFSPRLSHEHNRIAALVKEGETVVDLFAGIGPFAVQIAKTHENVGVYAIDINPDAIEYLKRNIRLNAVIGKVHPVLGDAREVVNKRLSGIADRAIMNLPEKAIEFVNTACQAIKPTGGTIHFYGFIRSPDSIENLKPILVQAVERCGRKVEDILFSRIVRGTAPYEWQAVLDASIR